MTTKPKFMKDEIVKKVADIINNKVVLVTGGTGSFGNAFISVILADYKVKKIIVFSRDELKQSVMMEKFPPSKYPQLRFFLGDVRDPNRIARAFRGVDIVIHAAALKQVPALEYNPTEAIKTNIIGAMNIIDGCLNCGVKQLVALSTDKAAAPINLYGATKLCSDKLFVAGNSIGGVGGTNFSVVRYGNVFGSRGSIVPVFHELRKKGKVGITDSRMTRFNISLGDAVNFVLSGLAIAQGGEIFIPKLPSYILPTIAKAVCPECEVWEMGRRPGEKLHELMVPADESYRTVDVGDRFIIEPEGDAKCNYTRSESSKPVPEGFDYNSGNNTEWNSVEELRKQYVDWCATYGVSADAPRRSEE
jgi:UDP-N-acetylglucosamine 4,6-dehydratase (inverting)